MHLKNKLCLPSPYQKSNYFFTFTPSRYSRRQSKYRYINLFLGTKYKLLGISLFFKPVLNKKVFRIEKAPLFTDYIFACILNYY